MARKYHQESIAFSQSLLNRFTNSIASGYFKLIELELDVVALQRIVDVKHGVLVGVSVAYEYARRM